MIRRPPRSTQSRSSAASDVYKRQLQRPQTHLQVHQPDVYRPSRKIQIQTPTLPRQSLPPRSHRPIPLQTTRFSITSQPWPNQQQSPGPKWSQSPSSKGTKVRVSYPGTNHSTAAKSSSSGLWPRLPRWQSPEPAPRFPVLSSSQLRWQVRQCPMLELWRVRAHGHSVPGSGQPPETSPT